MLRSVGVAVLVAGLAVAGIAPLASCKDPTYFSAAPLLAPQTGSANAPTAFEDCPVSAEWFPVTPPVPMYAPSPHPDTECPFYRGAYQNFLLATQPDPQGRPALVHYATLDDAFVSATPHATRNTAGRAWLGTVLQAGYRNVLIDQDGHTLYYGIHMNQAFVDFIRANGLQTVSGILNVDPMLAFPPGLVELKTAWKDIDPGDFPGGKVPPPGGYPGDPGDYSNYITTTAWVPHLSKDPQSGAVVEDPDHPRLIKVALVAIHAVFTLPGHPELVWGSIQHVNLGATDPTASAAQGTTVLGAPDDQPDPAALPSSTGFLLYKAGTPEDQANQAYSNQALSFDEASQSFPGQQTSIYRVFPGSKSQQVGPDAAVISLDANLTNLAQQQQQHGALDVRLNYHLVSAIWMDKPVLFGLGPTGQGMSLQNDDGSNPLVVDAVSGHGIDPQISEGTTCGTPLGPGGGSGDIAGAANTVPGCRTRADVLASGAAAQQTILQDLLTNGTDSPFSILGGEDRLSSAAMESFTQAPVSFPNCFSCHNTEPVTANGVPASRDAQSAVILQKPALINVSHIFSEFVTRECGGPPSAACGAP